MTAAQRARCSASASIKAQIADRGTARRPTRRSRSAAQALIDKLTDVEGEIYQHRNRSSQDPLNYPIRLNNKLAALQGIVESGDYRPTDQSYAVFKELSGRLDKELARLDALVKTDLARSTRRSRRRGSSAGQGRELSGCRIAAQQSRRIAAAHAARRPARRPARSSRPDDLVPVRRGVLRRLLEGRSDGLLPGETIKNLVHSTARQHGAGEIETLGARALRARSLVAASADHARARRDRRAALAAARGRRQGAGAGVHRRAPASGARRRHQQRHAGRRSSAGIEQLDADAQRRASRPPACRRQRR